MAGMTACNRAHFHQAPGKRHQVLLLQHYPAPSPTSCLVPGYLASLSYGASMQPSCSNPLNWGKKTSNTQMYSNNPAIGPGRTKGAQAPSATQQEVASRLQQDRPCSCCRLPHRQRQKRAGKNLQLLSWKFPTVAFTTG